jgi:BirA family transcriptional regulator, biotin operon repressor / biotin---[acetyl-CoA-carboxylase] ligase
MNTLFTGQNIIKLPEHPSVNTYAIELLKAVKVHEGTVIITDKQTAGRGQRGKAWHSEEKKNITMSVVYHPGFLNASNSFLLSMMASLALHDLLTEQLTDAHAVKIKWPNDLYAGGKKIAGILIENIYREEQIISSVIGIGLNVNQENFGELDGSVNSLKLATGRLFELKEILESLCGHLESRYLQLRTMNVEKVKGSYMKRLFLLGEAHKFTSENGEMIEGKIEDVKGNGKLVLQLAGGGKREFDVKEIVF